MKRPVRLLIGATLVMTALATSGLRTAHAATGGGNLTCTGYLTGVITGNLIVPAGAVCQIDHATIGGNVIVQPGGILSLIFSTVQRNVLSDRGANVSVGGDQVLGNVELTGDTGFTAVTTTTVGGELNLSGTSVWAELINNTIAGDVHFNNNNTASSNNSESNEIIVNTVGGVLQCAGNNPAPYQAYNVAGSYAGQCGPGVLNNQ